MNIFRYLDLARNMTEKYSFECVKFYTSWFFYVKLQLDIKKAKLKTNKRYQNLKNNKQKSDNKIQKYTKPEKITMCFRLLKRPELKMNEHVHQ
jgi:hypothetical protein